MSYLATQSNPREEVQIRLGDSEVGRLRLRGATRRDRAGRPRVVWREDVVDNEGAGERAPKVLCCIYHKPRRYDESSSEESSDSSDSDSDSDCDSHSHSHSPRSSRPHSHNPRRQTPEPRGEGGSNTRDRDGSSVVHELHDPSGDANRYERQPKRKGVLKGVSRND
ncbi:phosphatase inhibitor-domain-containing protein, partial [Irpex lacteus]